MVSRLQDNTCQHTNVSPRGSAAHTVSPSPQSRNAAECKCIFNENLSYCFETSRGGGCSLGPPPGSRLQSIVLRPFGLPATRSGRFSCPFNLCRQRLRQRINFVEVVALKSLGSGSRLPARSNVFNRFIFLRYHLVTWCKVFSRLAPKWSTRAAPKRNGHESPSPWATQNGRENSWFVL